jgi:hypothetical protein
MREGEKGKEKKNVEWSDLKSARIETSQWEG